MKRTGPVKCRCACHRSGGGIMHFVRCCCVHRYERDCPHCTQGEEGRA